MTASDPRRVLEYIEELGEDDALDLFGWQRVAQAFEGTLAQIM